MINEERLLKVLLAPNISEKATVAAEANNTVVFKVTTDATKAARSIWHFLRRIDSTSSRRPAANG